MYVLLCFPNLLIVYCENGNADMNTLLVDQRMARRSKREEDKHNAPMRKRTQDLKNMLQGAGLDDPMRALSKRGSGRV